MQLADEGGSGGRGVGGGVHDPVEEGRGQCDLLLGLDCQCPYERERHGQHDEPVDDVGHAQPLRDNAEINAFPAAEALIPSESYGRALEDGDKCIRGAGYEHDEGNDKKGEGEVLHLGGEDAEVEEEDSTFREDD